MTLNSLPCFANSLRFPTFSNIVRLAPFNIRCDLHKWKQTFIFGKYAIGNSFDYSKVVDCPISILAVSIPTAVMHRLVISHEAASGESPGKCNRGKDSGPVMFVP